MTEQTESEKRVGGDEAVSAEELLVTTPLYKSVAPNPSLLRALREEGIQFDCFCIQCDKDSPFKTTEFTAPARSPSISSAVRTGSAARPYVTRGHFTVIAACQRNTRHHYLFHFQLGLSALTKVGQWPSLEDIMGGDLAPLRPVLSPERYSELKRATGLASHGIGIGAFVYLRRIFEGLIAEHYQALLDAGQAIDGWGTMRMDEKVGELASVLPRSLVENKSAYSILSAGVHELDEQTCRDYFPVIRQAIIVILREDLRTKQEQEEAQRLRNEIGMIAGKVKKGRAFPDTAEGVKKSDHAS